MGVCMSVKFLNSSKEEFRWSYRKKGKHVLNMCAHLVYGLAIGGFLLAGTGEALANPTGGSVKAGSATISSSGSTLQINQHTNRAIIEWSGFDIAAGETTKFIQPGASSIALNRVVNATQASVINGNLLANGKILVINPNGVLIGATGKVDVAGFVASSADIDNNAFMNAAGAMEFNKAGNLNAVVENKGNITIGDAGLGLLVAPTVRNEGVIQGNLAKIQLGAGDTFGVDLYGDGLLHLAVATNGQQRDLSVENAGTIVANAGKVIMTAAAASDVVNSVINTSGVIEAKGLVSKGGEIILTGAGATVKVSGKLDASGKTGGGDIKIGGDYQGGGTLEKADETFVSASAEIKANAEDAGLGGTIIVWANEVAEAVGKFFAQGGANGGDGGLIETSSTGALFVEGIYVNALAPKGKAGDWLLDPSTININATGVNYDPFWHNTGLTFGTVDIGVATINAASANVNLWAWDDINFNANVNIAAAGVGLTAIAGRDISISNKNLVTNNGDLGFSAGRDFKFTNSSIDTNGGDVVVDADRSISFSGTAANPSTIMTDGGKISLTVVNNLGVDTNDSFNSNRASFGTGGGDFTVLASAGDITFQRTTVNTTGGSGNGSIDVAEFWDSNITENQLGNNNDYYSGSGGGDISVYGYDVKQSNNNCFKAGGSANACGVSSGPATPIAITVTADSKTKIYGSLDAFLSYTVSAGALLSGDSFTGALSRVAGENVGVYAITKGTLSIVSPTMRVYDLTFIGNSYFITPATLTITAQDQSKTYGQTANLGTTEFDAFGLKFSDDVSNVTLTSLGAPAAAAKGTYNIDASNAIFSSGLSTNYTINYVPGTLTVDPALLTITAKNQTKEYGDTFTFAGNEFTTSGLVNGDSVASASLSSAGAAATANVDSNLATAPIDNYSIGISGANGSGLSNYTITYVNGTMTLTPAAVSITAADVSKVYGSDWHGVNFTSPYYAPPVVGLKNTDHLVGGFTVNSGNSPAIFSTTAGVGTYNYYLGGASFNVPSSNYTVTYLPGTLTITPKVLTVTAKSFGKTYGDLYTFAGNEFTTSGLINGDAVTSASFASAGAPATANVGQYGITVSNASGNGLSNYTISYVNGKLTVNKARLTIVANNQTKEYGDTFTFAGDEFAVTGLKNSDEVTSANFASLGQLAGADVIFNPYTISVWGASGSGLGNYTITYKSGKMYVTPAPLTIKPLDASKVYGTGFPDLPGPHPHVEVTGLKNHDAVTGVVYLPWTNPELFSTRVDVGNYSYNIDGIFMNTFKSNYSITYLPGKLSITPKALTVTANSFGKTYGDTYTFEGNEFTTSGLINGDHISSVDLASDGAAGTAGVGHYAINGSNAEGCGLQNYEITYVNGDLNVTPRDLFVGALSQSKIYGNEFIFNGNEFEVEGLVNEDTVTGANFYSFGANPTANVGSYYIDLYNVSGSGLENYNIYTYGGTMNVTPRALTLTANNITKAFGTKYTFNGTEFTADGLVNGDTIDGVNLFSPGSPAPKVPGNYVIFISGGEILSGGERGEGGQGSFESTFARTFFYKGEGDYYSEGPISNYDITYVNGVMNIPAPTNVPGVFFDALGRPIVSVANNAIVTDRPFEAIDFGGRNTNVSISSSGGNAATRLASIEPAAGGDNPEDLANIEPAAGGDDTGTGGDAGYSDVSCVNDFLDNQPCQDNTQ